MFSYSVKMELICKKTFLAKNIFEENKNSSSLSLQGVPEFLSSRMVIKDVLE